MLLLKHELQMFLSEQCFYVPGALITHEEFVDAFHRWLPAESRPNWSKIKVGKQMPLNKFPKGRRKGGQWSFGNLSLTAKSPNIFKWASPPEGTEYLVVEALKPEEKEAVQTEFPTE